MKSNEIFPICAGKRLLLCVLFSVFVLLSPESAQARSIGYDAAGRVAWTIQPGGQTTTFGYDANGNLESIVSITLGEDTDGDGIPDYYELRFTGNITGLNPAADDDNDGYVNLFEYAFARRPDMPDAGPVTVISVTAPEPGTGDRFYTLTYTRPQSGTLHLDYVTKISFDTLDSWITGPPEVIEETVVPAEGGVEVVTVRFLGPVGSVEKFFMRISVTKP